MICITSKEHRAPADPWGGGGEGPCPPPLSLLKVVIKKWPPPAAPLYFIFLFFLQHNCTNCTHLTYVCHTGVKIMLLYSIPCGRFLLGGEGGGKILCAFLSCPHPSCNYFIALVAIYTIVKCDTTVSDPGW